MVAASGAPHIRTIEDTFNAMNARRFHITTYVVSILTFGLLRFEMAQGHGTQPFHPSDGTDSRLYVTQSSPLTISIKSEPLAKALDKLSIMSGRRLRPDSVVSDRRITVLSRGASFEQIIDGVARVVHGDLREADPQSGAAYELFMPEDRRKVEERLKLTSIRREEAARSETRRALLSAISRAIRHENSQPSVADFIRSLSADEARKVAYYAALPMGVIDSDGSHKRRRLLFATPFSNLPLKSQSRLSARLMQPERAPDGTVPGHSSAVKDQGAIQNSYIGLAAIEGFVHFAVLPSVDDDVWISPYDIIHRNGLPNNREEIYDPVPTDLLDWGDAPVRLRSENVHLSGKRDTESLPDVLETLANQVDISFVADDYFRSRKPTRPRYPAGAANGTLNDVLLAVASAFSHRFEYANGVMRVTTLTPGLDLRAEPRGELLKRLREFERSPKPLGMEDYLKLSRLSDLQLNAMITTRPPVANVALPLLRIQNSHEVLRFYASLPEEKRAAAESERGLLWAELDTNERREFDLIADVGIPHSSAYKRRIRKRGLYVHRIDENGITRKVEFIVASGGSLNRVTMWELILR